MRPLLTVVLLFFIPAELFAQLPRSIDLPRVSPKETRSITIGLTNIAFEYSSVGVKGREVWGELVPYGKVWRTGANENTLVSFSDSVLINEQPLPAGTYAMHTIPGKEEWVIIFSEFTQGWGSYFYDESEDALRVRVTPQPMDSDYEWMKFSFSKYTDTSVEISIKWANLKVPFTVTVPRAVTFNNIASQLRSLPAFSWHGWYQAAQYSLQHEYKLDTGLKWADNALEREKNHQTVGLKAHFLAKTGAGQEALMLVQSYADEHPESWEAYLNLGRIHQALLQEEEAQNAFKKAVEIAPNPVKTRLRALIK